MIERKKLNIAKNSYTSLSRFFNIFYKKKKKKNLKKKQKVDYNNFFFKI